MKIPTKAIPFKERRDTTITKNDRILVTVTVPDTQNTRQSMSGLVTVFKRLYDPAMVEVIFLTPEIKLDISQIKVCLETGKIKKMEKLK